MSSASDSSNVICVFSILSLLVLLNHRRDDDVVRLIHLRHEIGGVDDGDEKVLLRVAFRIERKFEFDLDEFRIEDRSSSF
jgi:hypothetical protein